MLAWCHVLPTSSSIMMCFTNLWLAFGTSCRVQLVHNVLIDLHLVVVFVDRLTAVLTSGINTLDALGRDVCGSPIRKLAHRRISTDEISRLDRRLQEQGPGLRSVASD